ncbi:MAG: beta-ketoacyl synthase chain length factor [Bacteroidales bacterium]|nr:beta-ketoacyl synthase chain length factor [Bacteroidales bacterium]
MSIFINSASQISMQEPLSEKWLSEPTIPSIAANDSQEPDYKKFISPIEARRMGKILKRAVATSMDALEKAECEMPDAIVCGTGLGCIQSTEKFLNAMLDNAEECLPPTAFMQSTHNTISSQVALTLKCHNYNCTYSQQGLSFESALLDAFMQFELGKINSALVESHDEMTPDYFRMLGKIGYWKEDFTEVEQLRNADSAGAISGSASVAIALSNKLTNNTLCQLEAVEMLHSATMQKVKENVVRMIKQANKSLFDIDGIVLGLSGDKENDTWYHQWAEELFPNKPIIWYKHLFGESFSASALGLYVGAHVLHSGTIPTHLLYNDVNSAQNLNNLIVYNHFQRMNHGFCLIGKK